MSGDRIIQTIMLLYIQFASLRNACQELCLPPKDKREWKNFHIVEAETPFERVFCMETSLIEISKEDLGKITLEGYYPSCVMLIFSMIISFTIIVHFTYATNMLGIFGGVSLILYTTIFKKPILKLSSKILTKFGLL